MNTTLNAKANFFIIMPSVDLNLPLALLYIHFSKNESDFLYFLFIKTELKQGSDKPLFYAVLGIPVYMPVFNGGDSDSLAVMP